MKSNLKITFILCVISISLFSQEYQYVPFPDSGAVWSEIFYPPLDSLGNYPPPILERFALSGEDTVIHDTTYKKLYIFYDTAFYKEKATCIGGIREDSNKKIYYKGNTIHFLKPSYTEIINNGGKEGDEVLLYDFSLNEGDTLEEGNLSKYDEFLIVSKIDTIQIGNTTRKMFSFCLFEISSIIWIKWIEGIGSLRGLLFTSGDIPTNGLYNNLICYKQNNEILYFNTDYDECIPEITSIRRICQEKDKIMISPNPVTEREIRFDFGSLVIQKIEIIDTHGIVKDIVDVWAQQSYVYSTEILNPGIYFYIATTPDGRRYNGKFIIKRE